RRPPGPGGGGLLEAGRAGGMGRKSRDDRADSISARDRSMVLVRQREWIYEPEPGRFVPQKGERITEWQAQWLAAWKRGPDSIVRFLANPRPPAGQPPAND